MTRRNQFIVLGVLFVVLLISAYYAFGTFFQTTGQTAAPVAVDAPFKPLNVDNPALRMDILKRFLNLEYKGVHRNIFSATLPPPPPSEASKKAPPVNVAPPVPTGPPPLTVDAKYFGFVSDMGGSHRRAFFATPNNEDVFIAGEGDTLMGRFRVVRLTNTTADVEEVSSGRHATLILEEPGPNG
jgi:hypothetical protein